MKRDPISELRAMGVTMSVRSPSKPRPQKRRKATPTKTIEALRDLLRSQRGLSACSIVWALVPELRDFVDGMTGGELGNAPSDPSDFTRCQRVLALIPGGAKRIGEVALTYPNETTWSKLAEAWPELDALWHEEAKRTDRMAPKLYARMSEIIR